MAKPEASELARYLDRLERAVRRLRPEAGLNPWHMLSGAVATAFAVFIAGANRVAQGANFGPALAIAALLGALGFAWAGRRHWNALLAGPYPRLRGLVRRNLLEHELLLIAMESDLPARYEHLRYVAQSYGKTRARNYSELRRGSMVDRVQWLLENYQALCSALGLAPSLPELRSRQRRVLWLVLAPIGLVLLGIGLVAALGSGQHPAQWEVRVLLGSLGLMLLACGAGGGLAVQLQKLERAALASVLVEQLDLTAPQAPVAAD